MADPNTHHNVMELIQLLSTELAARQADPHAAREEREADRWLYEKLADYKGLLYRRPLTRSVEFLVRPPSKYGPGFQPGWYFKAPPQAGAAQPAFNWYGPHPTHRAAVQARDERFPKRQSQFVLASLIANPAYLKEPTE